jgi:hypothetical protein
MELDKPKIIVRFTYRNHLDEFSEGEHEFFIIQDLTNYFRWCPDRAAMLQYGTVSKEVMEKSRSTNVRLVLSYNGEERVFKDVYAFADYLRDNPSLAVRIGFR